MMGTMEEKKKLEQALQDHKEVEEYYVRNMVELAQLSQKVLYSGNFQVQNIGDAVLLNEMIKDILDKYVKKEEESKDE